ncbi:BglG family transcription antiterminator [Amphibacillus sp. Q70]|uniref:BglG family transcription antiterminator n=1 Tax=Amphibacillus sp. Q70 TaxID=3453416 RepID=UPI003F829493
MHSISSGERKLIQVLYDENSPISINQLQMILNRSRRMIYYYITNVDQLLKLNDIPAINVSEKGYFFNKEQKAMILEILVSSPIILSPEERVSYLICYLVFSNTRVTLDSLVEDLGVSRNAVLNDLLEVREILYEYQLELTNNKIDGYRILGDVYRKRSVFQTHIKKMLKTLDYRNLSLFDIDTVDKYNNLLEKVLDDLHIEIYKIEILSLAFLLASMQQVPSLFNYNIIDYELVSGSKELSAVEKYFAEFPHHERIYLAIQIISYNTENRQLMIEDDLSLLDLSSELINTFELLSCLKFNNKERLINSVYLHIQLTNYQFHHAIPTSNPLIDDIKNKYGDIFNITKVCCKKMKRKFPYPVFESEISFLTMHFAANLNKDGRESEKAKVLLVCLNTTIGSMLLKNEIENAFDAIHIIAIVKPSEISNYSEEDIDFIISTIKIDTPISLLHVNPILSTKDRNLIASHLTSLKMNSNDLSFSMKSIYEILRESISDDTLYMEICSKINAYLTGDATYVYDKANRKPTLIQMLNVYGVKWDHSEERYDWENAIRSGSEILLKHEIINAHYVQTMINLVKKYGPYIVINDDIAIAHAQPEDGVNHLGITLQVFSHGLYIRDKKVQLLFVLATPNQEDHLRILNDIIQISNNAEILQDIVAADDSTKLLEILRSF